MKPAYNKVLQNTCFFDLTVHLTGSHDGTVFDDRDVAFTFGEGKWLHIDGHLHYTYMYKHLYKAHTVHTTYIHVHVQLYIV